MEGREEGAGRNGREGASEQAIGSKIFSTLTLYPAKNCRYMCDVDKMTHWS